MPAEPHVVDTVGCRTGYSPANAFYASGVANEVVDIDDTDNKLYAVSGSGPRRHTARRLIRLPAADALERVQTSRD